MAPRPNQGHQRPTGDLGAMSLSHIYVPEISIWGSIGVLEAAHVRAKKKSPARPEMPPSTRGKPLHCNPAAWEGLGGQPYRRGAPGLRYGANIRTIHPTRAVRRSNSLCRDRFLALKCAASSTPTDPQIEVPGTYVRDPKSEREQNFETHYRSVFEQCIR